jgi:hypothetical protein
MYHLALRRVQISLSGVQKILTREEGEGETAGPVARSVVVHSCI